MIEQFNRFVKNPVSLDIPRSRFPRPHTHKTTFNSGALIPIYFDEVLPGDTFELKWSSVVKMLSPAVPVMDNAFMDLYFFFVPNRLATFGEKDWQKIQRENTSGYWAPSTESTMANTSNTFNLYGRSITPHSVANYLGLPILSNGSASIGNLSLNLLPFNAYIQIWNEWFRDQNTQTPRSKLYSGSSDIDYYLNNTLAVNRLHDYFTSVLPAPQKGASVLLPIGTFAPVRTLVTEQNTSQWDTLQWRTTANQAAQGGVHAFDASGASVDDPDGQLGNNFYEVVPSNLYADLANATATSVNEMRQAFAIQRLLEKDARGGTRLTF